MESSYFVLKIIKILTSTTGSGEDFKKSPFPSIASDLFSQRPVPMSTSALMESVPKKLRITIFVLVQKLPMRVNVFIRCNDVRCRRTSKKKSQQMTEKNAMRRR